MDNFNQLTNGEAERLAILLEELGEAQQAIGKILRHGYDSSNPFDETKVTNREDLERELGDVEFAISALVGKEEINEQNIAYHKNRKSINIKQYLHHDK